MTIICYTGEWCEKFSSTLPIRCGDEWFIGERDLDLKNYDHDHVEMYASVGGEPNQPPITGWRFQYCHTKDRHGTPMFKYEDDPTLTCRVAPTSPSCCLTVSLNGPAKEAQGKCEGVYMSTGLFSLGREVTTIINKKLSFSEGVQAERLF